MSDAPVTIGPAPKKQSIKLGELIRAVRMYLSTARNTSTDSFEIEPVKDMRLTAVNLYGVTVDGARWEPGKYLTFDVDGICARSENANLGGDLRIVTIKVRVPFKVPNPMPKGWSPPSWDVYADLVAEKNADKSITLFKIKRWEGSDAIFNRGQPNG